MPQLTRHAALQIQRAIPAARFQTYLDHGHNVVEASQLYLWNAQAASAVTEITGMVEVLLRETIDRQLRAWNVAQGGSEEWITAPAGPALAAIVRHDPPAHWSPRRLNDLHPRWWEKKARDNFAVPRPGRPHQGQATPTHDDLVASLNFGSWTSILPNPQATSSTNDRLLLWNQTLGAGFTNVRREAVYTYAHELRWMRNRAAHLRPMLDIAYLLRTHRYAIRLLRSIDTDFAQIIAGQATIPEIIKGKPTSKR